MEKAKLMLDVAQLMMKVAEDAHALADSIQAVCKFLTEGFSGATELKADKIQTKPSISMEQVRGVLADKSRAGHTDEIKAILKKYGADRLSDVKPEHYEAIMKEAEGLTDE